MSLTQKVAYNTLVQITGKVITTAVSLVLIAAITRYLGVSGYGEYTTIFAYVSFWAVLADFGFFWILVRELSKSYSQEEKEKIFNNIVTLRSVLGIIIFLLAFLIALFIPSYPMIVKLGIGTCAAGWFWISINSTYVGLFQANLKMHYAVLTDVMGRLIILALVLFFIKLGYGLNTIIWAYFAGNLVNFILSVYFGRLFSKFKLAFDWQLWKKSFYEALPMGMVLILGILYFKIDTVMLSLFKSSKDVGIYGAPFKILEILLLIPAMFMGNVFPIITKYLEEKDARLNSALQKSFDFLVICALPIVAGAMILAPQIINFVAGQEFVNASTMGPFWGQPSTAPTVLRILIITVGIYFISQLFNNTIIAMGRQKEMVKPYLIFALVNILLNLYLIPKFSYIGAAIVTIITAILVLYFTARIVFHYYKDIKIDYLIMAKAFIASLLMTAFLFFSKSNLFLSITIGAVVYGVSLYLLGGLPKELIRSIIKDKED